MPRLGDKITAVTGGNSGIGVANSNSLGMRMTTAGLKDIVHEIGRWLVPLLASVTFPATVSASAHSTTSAISGAENRAALIANAESAGPDAIAATILAWPTTPGGEMTRV
jgi:hypothetical protein